MQKVIVAFTSYPGRIGVVNKVVQSLFRQSVHADEIILYLSAMEFPYKEEGLPGNLVELLGKNGFKIEWVEDNLKSHKKYYYALQEKAEDIVITVDDDTVYAETLISDLMKSFREFPYAVSARRVRIMIKEDEQLSRYAEWDDYLDEYVNAPRMDLCAIGVGGILYPPHCASDRWFGKKNIKMMAKNQDDLWLKANEIIDGYPVVYVKPTGEDMPIEGTYENSLSIHNLCGMDNEICIEKLSGWLKNDYPKTYCEWLQSLQFREDYIVAKKHYYYKAAKLAFGEARHMPVYLYGAGKKAKYILKILYDFGMADKLDGIIVSNGKENPDTLEGIKVTPIEALDKDSQFGVICGVKDSYKCEIDHILRVYHYKYVDIDFRGIKRYYDG